MIVLRSMLCPGTGGVRFDVRFRGVQKSCTPVSPLRLA